MTLDDALAQPGRLVAAWDYRSADRGALEVYVTSDAGARRIHREEVPPEQRQTTSERVREKGIRLGGSNASEALVWVFDDRGFGVWSDKAALVEGSQMVIGLRGGAIKARDIKKVMTSGRGVRCELATGSEVPFVDEQRADPTWAAELGVDFAMWLGVAHVDANGHVTNAHELEVRTQCRALADAIDKLPTTGAFEHVIHVVGTFAPRGKLQFRYAPNPLDETKRFLELRLHTPTGKSSWAKWVGQGTNEQVAAFLRQLRTPFVILVHMEAMAIKLAQEQYE